MMRKPLRRLPVLSVLFLAACGGFGGGTEREPETIRDLGEREPAGAIDAPAEPSEAVVANPERALENYRELLALSSDESTRAEAQRRIADLLLMMEDTDPEPGSKRRVREAIMLYRRLLDQRPNDPKNDRVRYQLARALQQAGEVDAAIRTLGALIEEHPDSPYAADGRFRRAELLFASRRYAEAAESYEAVINMAGQTPFFEVGQYKYAWTLYHLGRYEDALEVIFSILDRELPEGAPHDPEETLAEVPQAQRDLARDVLRLSSLSLTAMGGGEAANAVMAGREAPRFYPLIYAALGEFLLERERYSDAAEAYAAFIDRYPGHELAPDFQVEVVDSYRAGDFESLRLAEQERYIETYAPTTEYWDGKSASETVLGTLRAYLDDLSSYYHARAQEATRDAEWPAPQADYLTAAGWYRRTLDIFPDAEDAAEVHFLMAETLLAGGETVAAAEAFHATAYDYPPHERSGEAGYAAVLAYYEAAEAVEDGDRTPALRRAVDEATQFAEAFPEHPERLPVLTRAAEDLYRIADYDNAISVAARVLNETDVPAELLRSALTVRADAEFTLERFAEAESSYIDLMGMLRGASAEERARVADQLALSIFRQGEALETEGDKRAAVAQYLRIGQVTPGAEIRPNAEYDAAVLLAELEDWQAAARVLEGFQSRYPRHALAADADKRLATAYEEAGQPARAADAYARIAERSSESPEVREEAAWKAATLFDDAGRSGPAISAYERYLDLGQSAAARETRALRRLIALTGGRDTAAHQRWLQRAASAGGSSPEAQLLAAEARLALGRAAAEEARQIRLTQPLRESIARRREKVQEARDHLDRAAGYGFESVTPAATLALAGVYEDFAEALLESEPPPGLSGAERDEYMLLLEDQAFPLEEQAIALHEANLRRIPEGAWNSDIRASWRALQEMVPARYGEDPILEEDYAALR
jgi:TolA-binding protein